MAFKVSHALAAAAAVCAVSSAFAADIVPAARSVRNFDNDWRFFKGDARGADAPQFADADWTKLRVPHDWSIEGPYAQNAPTGGAGGFLPAGVGWYRKSFTLDAAQSAQKFRIQFDGVLANSDVWINGFHLGKRPYGFISFEYDMTGHLKFDGTPNVLSVRADDSAQPASRFYIGAGIYRHVRLVATDPVHIETDGTFVTTPKVAPANASVHVRASVINESAAAREVSVRFRLLAPDGKEVASAETKPQTVAAGKSLDFEQDAAVAMPKIWDLDHPDMYTAVATVLANGKAIDDDIASFGIRTFEFNGQTGFSLNGKNFKLMGVCLHAEAGGLGAAVPEDEWIYRLQTLKNLGTNAVRTAHNPPSPEFLDACDRVGMLVMDEMFDCWDVAKTRADYHLYFDQWHLQDTQDTVRRDRNHPSIILYSAGNEIHDTPNAEKAKAILGPLVKTFHDNDPTRPMTQALFRPNSDGGGGAYKNGLSDMLDVVGTNYRDAELVAAHRAKPSISIIGTENGKTLANWAIVRDNPFYAGHFIWTGVDYLGESKAWPEVGTPDGIVDISDRPKAEGYQRASWWSTKSVVYMARARRRWQVATGKENPDEPQQRFTAVRRLDAPRISTPTTRWWTFSATATRWNCSGMGTRWAARRGARSIPHTHLAGEFRPGNYCAGWAKIAAAWRWRRRNCKPPEKPPR